MISPATAGHGGSVLDDTSGSSSPQAGLVLVLSALPRPPPGLEHGADVIRGQGASPGAASRSPHSGVTGVRHAELLRVTLCCESQSNKIQNVNLICKWYGNMYREDI